jgi:hypothetical protein
VAIESLGRIALTGLARKILRRVSESVVAANPAG